MHVLGAADDGVDRAGLDALGAADAVVLDHQRDLCRLVLAAAAVVRARKVAQQSGQRVGAVVATGRATVGPGLAGGHGFGVGPAPGVAALAALGLREQAVQAFDK